MKLPNILSALLLSASLARAENVDAMDWPRVFETPEYEIALYQPQVHEWNDFKHAVVRVAVGIQPSGKEDEKTFGAITAEFDTTADFEERVVHIGERKVKEVRFPDAKTPAEEMAYKKALRAVLSPTRPLVISLDAMIANVDRTEMQAREVEANLKPPPIHFSPEPALLVMFLGPPKFESLPGVDNGLFAVNTNWDVLLDADTATYYLLADSFWLSTTDLKQGPWSPVKLMPDKFVKIPDNENWGEVRARFTAPTIDEEDVPKIFFTDRPAELIITDGSPQLTPIAGTKLLEVANTNSDVFFYGSEKKFFFLTAGRWFSAPKLEGPWSAATTTLPAEFAKIPPDHAKAHVLASVPGTAEAEEAVIMASIPQTATINRSEINLTVAYDGEPKFATVPGTEIKFATNTPYDVFQVGTKYYCCYQGVWFEAPEPGGEWVVCTKVPEEIYAIPPESPKHNVTYVQVYDATPTTVTTGYTSGYGGTVVSNGLVMFGLGYWLGDNDDDWWEHHYYYRYPPHPYYYGYGCAAVYNPYYGGYYRGGYHYYGPYGGAGGAAVYNPWTGTYGRAEYRYGPRGAAGYREAYNPWTGGYVASAGVAGQYGAAGARGGYNPYTDTYAARAGATTPYGSWGRSAVVRDDEWARAGHRSNWQGSVSAVETSQGNAAVHVDRNYGSDSTLAKYEDDVYVGKDGNIYKRDDDGSWSNRQDGSWNSVEQPESAPRNWTSSAEGRTLSDATQTERSQAIQERRSALQPRTDLSNERANKRSSYESKRTTSQQLDWDRRSRERSSHERSLSSPRGGSRSSGRSRGGRRR